MKKIFTTVFLLMLAGVKAQLPSLSFEGTWPASPFNAAPDPSGWVTTNVLTSPFISSSNATTTTQHTLACNGNASMRIETKTFVTTGMLSTYIPTIAGFGFAGQIVTFPSVALRDGFPYNSKPTSVSYCYIAQPQPQDTAGVRILLWRYAGTRNYIGFAEKKYTTSNNSLANETLTISYTSTLTPDSMGIYVASSFKFPTSGFTIRDGAKPGSILILDNITFNISGLNDYSSNIKFNVFPNPANQFLFIQSDNIQKKNAVLVDLTGKVIFKSYFEDRLKILTEKFEEGLYILQITDENGKPLVNRKINIVH
ncbi:MAG: T9SS type A sorting domain-containing protein [Bacteroidia bacterium]|nr:T9SS type A sorting domain-containing protein [Bacteroidia bacterium]